MEEQKFTVNVESFGFKNGIPAESDFVFDVRFLPNPFYIEALKEKNGRDQEVRDYVMSHGESEIFLNKLTDMVNYLIPAFASEGKHHLNISIGCTGGQHRSATLAIELHERLKDKGAYLLSLKHRDI
jgi:UPF0042 nucleotide-binding protein